MASIGTLFRNEIGVEPIAVNYELDTEDPPLGPVTGLDGLPGRLWAHDDSDFARKNIGERFTLVVGNGGLKIRLQILSELGDFIGDGFTPLPEVDQERWRRFVDRQPPC